MFTFLIRITGTIVTPGQPAYNKEEHKKETEMLEKDAKKKDEDATKTGGNQ